MPLISSIFCFLFFLVILFPFPFLFSFVILLFIIIIIIFFFWRYVRGGLVYVCHGEGYCGCLEVK